MGWIITVVLVSFGWIYTIGDRAHCMETMEKEIEKKADLTVVEQAVKRLDEKMDLVLKIIQSDRK